MLEGSGDLEFHFLAKMINNIFSSFFKLNTNSEQLNSRSEVIVESIGVEKHPWVIDYEIPSFPFIFMFKFKFKLIRIDFSSITDEAVKFIFEWVPSRFFMKIKITLSWLFIAKSMLLFNFNLVKELLLNFGFYFHWLCFYLEIWLFFILLFFQSSFIYLLDISFLFRG